MPDSANLLGRDAQGRDLFTRVIYGGRVSLFFGASVTIAAVAIGVLLAMIAGYHRYLDLVIMRIMDGVMAMPGLLLALSIVAVVGPGLLTILIAITIPEIPRVVRLVRSVVLSAAEEPYVEAARSLGSSRQKILLRHLLPNAVSPLVVLGSYICASAILTEAVLSFLGVGISSTTASWGNIMSDGRIYFQIAPRLIFWPALFLSLTILSVNMIGDVLRDRLDPRLSRRGLA